MTPLTKPQKQEIIKRLEEEKATITIKDKGWRNTQHYKAGKIVALNDAINIIKEL